MNRTLAGLSLAVLLSANIFAQTPSTPPVFEVADVHSSPAAANAFMRGGFVKSGRYELHTASLVDLIATAYDVENDSVFGGPNWLDSDRFEILAKAASSSTEADRRLMLQALLADRFALAIHKEDKPLDVFTLTAGKKVQLKESEGEGEPDCTPDPPTQGNGPPPYIVLHCRRWRAEGAGFVGVLWTRLARLLPRVVHGSTLRRGHRFCDLANKFFQRGHA